MNRHLPNISIHALREEGDNCGSLSTASVRYFYPRPPRGGRPGKVCWEQSKITYFYPRPPRGGRLGRIWTASFTTRFLSTPSARRATPSTASRLLRVSDFYPRPPRGGRQRSIGNGEAQSIISIHALREEGDANGMRRTRRHTNFYPRPPRGGRPSCVPPCAALSLISIHALREEGDRKPRRTSHTQKNFYPRPPRGGRRRNRCLVHPNSRFLSTPSARRATGALQVWQPGHDISIHALREEGDCDCSF